MPDYPVRLVGGNSENEGCVQVFHQGTWGSVCGTLTDEDAAAICHTLGFSGGEVSVSTQCGSAVSSTSPVWLEGLSCSGNEQSILDCPLPPFGVHQCQNHSDDAQAVLCTGQ